MNDSNWKKLIKSGMIYLFSLSEYLSEILVQSILRKWKIAVTQKEDMKNALDELTDRISDDWITEWKKLEEKAMRERGDALKIYDVAETRGA
jgi:hypothetical protein